MSDKTAYRGTIFYFKDTATIANLPVSKDQQSEHDRQYVYLEDGVLIVEAGKVVEVGNHADLKNKIADIKLVDYHGKFITPGFIDTHQHATQSAIVAAYGDKLLEWLDNYVFPAESAYSNDDSARKDFLKNYKSVTCGLLRAIL
jgi:guanine deaminase